MNYEIEITVDTNDGDYNTEVRRISEENLNKIRPLIQAIKNFKPYTISQKNHGRICKRTFENNYATGECVRNDMGEKSPKEYYTDFSEEIHRLFMEFCPYVEYGFHTIISIKTCPERKKEILL